MSAKFEVNWEQDDDGSFDKEFSRNDLGENADFASMMQDQPTEQNQTVFVGKKVKALITHISSQGTDVVLELGGKISAVMAKQELMTEEGELKATVGQEIEAYVISNKGGEYVLSTSLGQAAEASEALELAYETGLPVKGKVVKDNKGGFEITIMGKNAFCPVSQIDLKFVDDKTDYIGKEFDFIITKLEKRNMVVSRSELLKKAQIEIIEKIKSELSEGSVIDGTVDDIRSFGLMVDIGGVNGMVHISEASHSRLANLEEDFRKGQKVRVKVLAVGKEQPVPRISLSIKQVEGDPWDNLTENLKFDDTITGDVVRLETFGAFVEIFPGVEGLIHVSEMSWIKRIHHPKDILKVGDKVEVRVLSIDSLNKRISLTMKSIDDDPWLKIDSTYQEGSTHKAQVQSLKGFGAIVELTDGLTGLLPMGTIKKGFGESYKKHVSPPKEVEVIVIQIDKAEKKILLGLPNIEMEDDSEKDFKEYLQKNQEPKPKADDAGMGSFGALLQNSLKKD